MQTSAHRVSTDSAFSRTASVVAGQASTTTRLLTDATHATPPVRLVTGLPGPAVCLVLLIRSFKETKPVFVMPGSSLRQRTLAQPATTVATHAPE